MPESSNPNFTMPNNSNNNFNQNSQKYKYIKPNGNMFRDTPPKDDNPDFGNGFLNINPNNINR